MSEIDERSEFLAEISRTNLIPSLKAQLRMAVCERLRSRGGDPPTPPVSEQSEFAKNIILEFLYASGFHSTASVFYTESHMHQMPRDTLIEGLQVSNSPGLLAELLITHTSHPSISTQTENIDLSAKLEAVEQEMKRKRQVARYQSTEEILRHGIEQLEHEFEDRFQTQLNQQLDLFRAGDLSMYQSEERRRINAELDRLKREMEAEFRQKATELRVQFQRDADVLRVKQRELEREIGKWADHQVRNIASEAQISEAQRIREETERKAAKIEAKAIVLEQILEKHRRKLEDVRLEHNKAKREIERLQLAISMYGKAPSEPVTV
jgi:hypothetical protein